MAYVWLYARLERELSRIPVIELWEAGNAALKLPIFQEADRDVFLDQQ